jgi:hypothetical protein
LATSTLADEPRGQPPVVIAQDVRLCGSLCAASPALRLAAIEARLKAQPSECERRVLAEDLRATTKELKAQLQLAKRLAEQLKGVVPKEAAAAVPAAPLREEAMTGTVTATSGRVVVLEEDRFFSINKDTEYFCETGFDLTPATAEILTRGTALMAVGKKDVDGEFVAVRVIALLSNRLRGAQPK